MLVVVEFLAVALATSVGIVLLITHPTPTRQRRQRNALLSAWNKSWLKRRITTIATKIEHWIISIPTHRRSRKPNTRLKSQTYYIRKNRKRGTTARIASKAPSPTLGHLRYANPLFGLPSTRYTTNKVTTTRFDTDSFQLAVDNCASRCMTNNLQDYVTPPKPYGMQVTGLGNQMAKKIGTVRWKFEDDQGQVHSFLVRDVLYLPDLPFRIISPQHWAQNLRQRAECRTTTDTVTLHWNGGNNKRTVRLNKASNIALFRSAPSYRNYTAYIENNQIPTHYGYMCFPASEYEEEPPHLIPDDDTQSDDDNNSATTAGTDALRTGPQQFDFHDEQHAPAATNFPERPVDDDTMELLRWHQRLGHVSFDVLRIMSNNGQLPKRLARCRIPQCPGCIYGKMTRRPWRTKLQPSKLSPRTITKPGQCVSVDQLESTTPGFIGQMKGILTKQRYRGATIFVDHYSRLSYVHIQRSLNAIETVEAKRAFEKFASTHGVTVEHYHADNGRFAENLWMQDVAMRGQSLSFCGVNAHFQNGVAEKRIRDLQEAARTAILDAKSKWPKAISINLWPYAIRHANMAHMSTPDRKGRHAGKSPIETFSNSTVVPNVKVFHPFGCPTYILHDKLQAGGKIQKWLPRARLGVYLGFSPNHARSVALVLNHQTGHASPQYHVKFDDLFETINYARNTALDVSEWQVKAGFKTKKDGIIQRIQPTEPTPRQDPRVPREVTIRPPPVPHEAPQGDIPLDIPEQAEMWDPGGIGQDEPAGEIQGTNVVPPSDAPTRRSGRRWKPTQRLQEWFEQRDLAFPVAFEAIAEIGLWEFDLSHPLLFLAKHGDPDTMYMHEALRQPDRQQFIIAMQKEVADHENRGHWELAKRNDIPDTMPILPSVWSMKRKRRMATGAVYKHKARLNVGGHKQEHGVNFWETYSPVVNWYTIRLFLVLALMFQWATKQVDFVLAYPQADIECEMYMEIPRGFHLPKAKQPKEYCLRLKKNLYGQKQAGRVWNKHVHQGIISVGFTQSAVDECLYYQGNTIFMLYVDDGLIIDIDEDVIGSVIAALKEAGYDLTDEGDLNEYLGVEIQRNDDTKEITLTQYKLIQQILSDLNFNEETKSVPYPAPATTILTRSEDAERHKATWNYRSIIGKLNYLEKSTRPELAVAVHQAARFSADPREPHTKAVHRIGRYLKGTYDKGIIMHPDDTSLEVYADADFAGLWDKQTAADDPTTAKSRSGFLIKFMNCPIIWMSKLQTIIALSTTESEYVSLSESLRQVIPIMNILEECLQLGVIKQEYIPVVKCTAFEDNSGALELARAPRMRPRTKHINIKYHHFRTHVSDGKVKIRAIASEDQEADLFTKCLPLPLFRKFRRAILGW